MFLVSHEFGIIRYMRFLNGICILKKVYFIPKKALTKLNIPFISKLSKKSRLLINLKPIVESRNIFLI